MTREEAIRILDPETMGETLAEIKYYGGFRGRMKAAQALYDACILAISAIREQEERERGCEYCQQFDDPCSAPMIAAEESDIDSLFSAGGTSALMSDVSGLDDFELICFLVVK